MKKFATTSNILLIMKMFVLTICLGIAFGGRYPPLNAQYQAVPVITTEDALQDDRIKTLQDQTSKQFVRLNAAENTLSGIQGEERTIGALLGLLSSAQIILQVRKKKEQ